MATFEFWVSGFWANFREFVQGYQGVGVCSGCWVLGFKLRASCRGRGFNFVGARSRD